MAPPPADPLISAVIFAIVFASIGVWAAIITRWYRGQPVLEYEPRTPVPWGGPLALVAVAFVAIALLSPSPEEPREAMSPLEVSQRIIALIFLQSVVIGAVLFVLTAIYRPNLPDLGLPIFADELARDVGLGILACLAAMAPVYGVQALLLYVFGPSMHPLVEWVTSGAPNVGLVLLATVAAVIVAPIGEELLFRLLLQGWLEKVEDRRPAQPEHDDESESPPTNYESALDDSTSVIHSSFDTQASTALPPPRGLLGLPHGWLPIFISSLLFAVAHYGHGPDPIALFLLAIILGYVYQRTHRIVPCIVAHAMFNSIAMFVLWRLVLQHVE